MAGLETIVNWLKGDPAPTKVELAPALTQYPTNDDAEYARKYGFGYGTGNEPFLNGEQIRSLGTTVPHFEIDKKGKAKKADPIFMSQDSVSALQGVPGDDVMARLASVINNPSNSALVPPVAQPSEHSQNAMMRGALAVNRSPIAALGFDPDKTIVDTMMPKGKPVTLAGMYDSEIDKAYANLTNDTPSVIAHESTHRGFKKLRELHPQEVTKAFDTLPNEEYVVRWLMNQRTGDPEKTTGSAGLEQREKGIKYMTNPVLQEQRKAALDKLEYLASEAIKNRRPGGPR